ncbi:MAG: GIDE domain-containing protein [bacterium]
MGFAELTGKAKQRFPLKSPLTYTDCVYYRFTIEKEQEDSEGRSYWEVVKEEKSTNYFYIEDDTGKILVDPLDAEAILPVDYQHVDATGGGEIRYTEWYIQPDEQVYVLGTVRKFKDAVLDRKKKLRERLRSLKKDKEKLKQFDVDKNGQISIEEWDKAREQIEQGLFEEELKQPQKPEDDIVIAKGDTEKTFVISDKSEKEVRKELGIENIALIFIMGFCLLITMGISLLAKSCLP